MKVSKEMKNDLRFIDNKVTIQKKTAEIDAESIMQQMTMVDKQNYPSKDG